MEEILDHQRDPVLVRRTQLEKRTYLIWGVNIVLSIVGALVFIFVNSQINLMANYNVITSFLASFMGYTIAGLTVGWMIGTLVALFYRKNPNYKTLKSYLVSICALLFHVLNVLSIISLYLIVQ